MSRRLRSRAAAIEAKRAFAWASPAVHDCDPEDDADDEGGIDAEPDDQCLHCRGDGMDPYCDYLLPCPHCGEVL